MNNLLGNRHIVWCFGVVVLDVADWTTTGYGPGWLLCITAVRTHGHVVYAVQPYHRFAGFFVALVFIAPSNCWGRSCLFRLRCTVTFFVEIVPVISTLTYLLTDVKIHYTSVVTDSYWLRSVGFGSVQFWAKNRDFGSVFWSWAAGIGNKGCSRSHAARFGAAQFRAVQYRAKRFSTTAAAAPAARWNFLFRQFSNYSSAQVIFKGGM